MLLFGGRGDLGIRQFMNSQDIIQTLLCNLAYAMFSGRGLMIEVPKISETFWTVILF